MLNPVLCHLDSRQCCHVLDMERFMDGGQSREPEGRGGVSRVSLQQEAMSTPERAKGKTSGTKPALPGLRDVEGGCVSGGGTVE